MQSSRNAAEATKEKAANVAASEKSRMEKSKPTMKEKGERTTTRDPLQKEMAAERKDGKQEKAEREKQQAHERNAPARQAAEATGHTTQATPGHGAAAGGYNAHVTGGTAPGYGAAYTGHGTGTGAGTTPGYGTGQYTAAGTVPGDAGHETSGTGATTGYGAGQTGHRATGADEGKDPNYPIGTEPGDRGTAPTPRT